MFVFCLFSAFLGSFLSASSKLAFFNGAGFVNRCFALIEKHFLIVAPINYLPRLPI